MERAGFIKDKCVAMKASPFKAEKGKLSEKSASWVEESESLVFPRQQAGKTKVVYKLWIRGFCPYQNASFRLLGVANWTRAGLILHRFGQN